MMTIQELATMAGVSTRTLLWYDQIGLLAATATGPGGRRSYDDQAVLRLQQILLYRELGMELAKIAEVLDRPEFRAADALRNHKRELTRRRQHLDLLLQTVDRTIAHLEGKTTMEKKELFRGLAPEEEAQNFARAEARWDPATVRESQRRWKSLGQAERQAILDEGNLIYQTMAAAMDAGPDSALARETVLRWRKHLVHFWTPRTDQLASLARVYVEDPRFKANIDALRPGLAEFFVQAVAVYLLEGRT